MQPPKTIPSAEPSQACRVLIVDDNQGNRLLLQAYLEPEGYSCEIAVNGAEAVERACCDPFDVVLMDIRMPVMDGHRATRLIRQWERDHALRPAVILAVSASLSSEDVAAALEAGCDTHVAKPVRRRQILELVDTFLSDGRSAPRAGVGRAVDPV